MRWILGSFKLDALFLILPGLVALAFARLNLFQENLVWIFLVTAFADSGHVYTTVWRTWFHPTERQRTAAYWLVPLTVAAVFFTWSALQLPYMWSFVIYATVHHNWKQYYGVTRWYETLNRHSVRWSGAFSKALLIIPVIAYHFRSNAVDGFYSEHDLFLVPSARLFAITLSVYLVTLAAWISFEIRNYRQGYREWNRISSIALSSTLYGGAFFFGTTVAQVLFPPMLGHGIGYLAMMAVATKRTRAKHFGLFEKGLAVMAATALVFGCFEAFVEKKFIDYSPTQASLLQALFIGLYLVPLFSHFIFDRFLWKRTHWESKLVYGLTHKPGDVTRLTETAPQTTAAPGQRKSS